MTRDIDPSSKPGADAYNDTSFKNKVLGAIGHTRDLWEAIQAGIDPSIFPLRRELVKNFLCTIPPDNTGYTHFRGSTNRSGRYPLN